MTADGSGADGSGRAWVLRRVRPLGGDPVDVLL
ncbi:hypothetical protein, partial [Frankia sp. AvcI1]